MCTCVCANASLCVTICQGAGFEALPETPTVAPVKGRKVEDEDLPDELDSLVLSKKKGRASNQDTAKKGEALATSTCKCLIII